MKVFFFKTGAQKESLRSRKASLYQVVDVQESDSPHDYSDCEEGANPLGEMERLEQPGQLLTCDQVFSTHNLLCQS